VALAGRGSAPAEDAFALAVVFVALVLVSSAASRVYDRSADSVGIQVRRITLALLRAAAVTALTAAVFSLDVLRPLVLVGVPVTWALIVGLRLVLGWSARPTAAPRRVLVVGTERAADAVIHRIRASDDTATEIVGVITESPDVTSVLDVPVRGGLADLRDAVGTTGATAVVVAAWSPMTQDDVRRLSWISEDLGVELLLEANLVDVDTFRVDVRAAAGMVLLRVSPPRLGGLADAVRCLADRAVALLLVLLAWPLLLGIGLLVRLTSDGPAIFRQERIGRGGEPFRMLKFRSMYLDAEDRLGEVRDQNLHGEGPLFKAREDPRVTPVGRYLRRFSLDELPQLWNVVRGEMALVGPRPPLPREVADYDQTTWRRLLVRPGLTGLWQVSGRSDLPWEESVRLDLRYVDNRSLGADLGILGRTGSAVVTGRGAY
jgi:exopolysaccharide biosynthesis polyprenyl glycosylphosphotransferase